MVKKQEESAYPLTVGAASKILKISGKEFKKIVRHKKIKPSNHTGGWKITKAIFEEVKKAKKEESI